MSTNFIQSGEVVRITGATQYSSGDVVSVGAIFGVAQGDSVTFDGGTTYETEVARCGGFTLAVASALDVSQGDPLYWDVADAEFNDDSTNNVLAGVAGEDIGVGTASGLVFLSEAPAVINAT